MGLIGPDLFWYVTGITSDAFAGLANLPKIDLQPATNGVGVTILVSGGLQVTDRREIASGQSCEEVAEIILMIRLIRLSDRSNWRQVMLVVCAGIILERFVVRNVIGH